MSRGRHGARRPGGRRSPRQQSGRLRSGQASGRLRSGRASGRLGTSQANGRLSSSQTNGRLRSGQARGRLGASQDRRRLARRKGRSLPRIGTARGVRRVAERRRDVPLSRGCRHRIGQTGLRRSGVRRRRGRSCRSGCRVGRPARSFVGHVASVVTPPRVGGPAAAEKDQEGEMDRETAEINRPPGRGRLRRVAPGPSSSGRHGCARAIRPPGAPAGAPRHSRVR